MNKYRNTPTIVDGIRFASKREAKRYQELRLLERAGEISALQLQPRFPIIAEGIPICTYIGDFSYWTSGKNEAQKFIVEDSKGVRTDLYRIKRKLVKALYKLDITEV